MSDDHAGTVRAAPTPPLPAPLPEQGHVSDAADSSTGGTATRLSRAGTAELPATTVAAQSLTREQLYAEITFLREAVESSDLVGQVKGLIRLLCNCSEPRSREILEAVSRRTDRTLHDVARTITESCASGTLLPADLSAAWGPYLRKI